MGNLKHIRINKGMSRAELSEKSGVKLTAIRDYEQNHKPINKASAISVYKLSNALDVKMEDLLDYDNI